MLKVRIEKLVYEGWGIGHAENGRTLLVKKAVPGDLIEVKVVKDKKTFAECAIKEIIEPSLKRVNPPCPYFGQCGGCDHQNIAYQDQLKFKNAIFAETLSRAGIDLKPEPIWPVSPEPFYYRNSIRFFFRLDRDNRLSFARQASHSNGLVPIESCLLQSETANEIMRRIKNQINENIADRAGFWQLKIRQGKKTAEFMVEIITSMETLPGERGIVAELKSLSGIKSIYHTVAPAKSLKKMRRRLIFGSPIIREKIGRFIFQISPQSFFQTNPLGAKTLYDVIKKYADLGMGDRVVDIFCGTGTIGIYLSTLAKEVIGVEIVPEAVRDARDNAKINKVHNCQFICDDSENWLSANLSALCSPLSIIILDPPRAGLTKRTIDLLSKTDFKKIVYVSCNPATFARDVKTFSEQGIELQKVQPIDMFPQTHHIECVGLLQKT